MSDKPKISVIIPVYNAQDYLKQAVDSIIGQTYRDIEIICIDDGSSDDSGKILDELAVNDERIQVYHQENVGLASTRNNGLKIAKGEYIYFMDNDDILIDCAFEHIIPVMDENRLDLLLFDTEPFITGDIPASVLKKYQKGYRRTHEYPGIYEGPELFDLMENNDEYRVAVFIQAVRRSFLQENDIRFIDGISHEDNLYTYLCMIHAKRVSYLKETLLARRLRGNSISTGKLSFDLVYGYFYSHLKMLETYQDLPEEKRCSAALLEPKKILNSARNGYLSLDETEKEKAGLLPEYEKQLFDMYVKDFTLFKKRSDDLAKKNRQLSDDLHKITSSKAFRLGETLAMPIRKIRDSGQRQVNKTEEKPEQIGREEAVWLIGTPDHQNLGDHQIAQSALQFLKDCYPDKQIFELTVPQAMAQLDELKDRIQKNDILFSMGGGSIGNYWPRNEVLRQEIIRRFPGNRIIILPQSIQYSNDVPGIIAMEDAKAVYQGNNITLTCRGRESYAKARQLFGCDIIMTPDMVMYSAAPQLQMNERKGALLCMRSDKEKRLSDSERKQIEDILESRFSQVTRIDMVVKEAFPVSQRKEILFRRYQQIADSQIVITDRLHSMIFAAQTETPCIVFENDHHKIRECYEWLKDLPYIRLIHDVSELEGAIHSVLSVKDREYPLSSLRQEFSPLIGKVKDDG